MERLWLIFLPSERPPHGCHIWMSAGHPLIIYPLRISGLKWMPVRWWSTSRRTALLHGHGHVSAPPSAFDSDLLGDQSCFALFQELQAPCGLKNHTCYKVFFPALMQKTKFQKIERIKVFTTKNDAGFLEARLKYYASHGGHQTPPGGQS